MSVLGKHHMMWYSVERVKRLPWQGILLSSMKAAFSVALIAGNCGKLPDAPLACRPGRSWPNLAPPAQGDPQDFQSLSLPRLSVSITGVGVC